MDKQRATKYNILVVDEKNYFLDFLASIEGVSDIFYLKDVESVFCHLTKSFYHLVVLVKMWDIESICKIIKTIRVLKKVPILVLASNDVEESALCIEAGADAALSSDCKKEEVKLLIFALMRRYTEWETEDTSKKKQIIQNGTFTMNCMIRKAFWKGNEIKFTKHEFDFLYLLASSPERVYTYSQIYQTVWDEYPQGNIANMIWCMISRIKKKLKAMDPDMPNMIHSVRDIGYFFELNTDV